MPLVDTNVLFDLAMNDPVWADWSVPQLAIQAAQDTLLINPVVYAELSAGYESIEAVDAFLGVVGVQLVEVPRRALFLAGKAYQDYRRRGGTKTGVLPDFFIGAHAMVEGIAILTRDPRRYRSYFADVRLITPGDA